MADVYVTKWALTEGILLCEEVEDPPVMWPGKYRRARLAVALNGCLFLSKPDWHLTLEEAEIQFETMRQAKMASLKRQLSKLDDAKPNVIDKRFEVT